MDKTGSKIPFARRRDWFALAVILAMAAVLWFTIGRGGEKGSIARVDFGTDVESITISLADDGLYAIEGGRLPVQLEVQGGKIRFVHSVCPDHTCERQGWLQRDGEQAICMPAAVSVMVIE